MVLYSFFWRHDDGLGGPIERLSLICFPVVVERFVA